MAKKKGLIQGKKKTEKKAYLFILPQMVLLFVLVIIPVLYSLVLAFCDWDFVSGIDNIKFVGLDNFVSMWKDPKFIRSFVNTIVFVAGVVPVSMGLSLVIAIILNRNVYCKGLLRLGFFIPYISSIVAVSIVWSFIFNPTQGPINEFLMKLGISNPPGWLTDSKWALVSLMIVSIWQALGYCIIIYLGGFKTCRRIYMRQPKLTGPADCSNFFGLRFPCSLPPHFSC